MTLNDNKKLQILNSIKITDIVSFDGYAEMIMVEDNRENRSKLYELGATFKNIRKYTLPDDLLEISELGFEIADSFNLENWKFYNKEECKND